MKPINIIQKLNESSKFESKRVPENEIEEKGYQYFSTHGVGLGTHPDDVKVRELDVDLPGGWVTFKTDRPLTSEELDYYDIQPETRNSEFKKRFKLEESDNKTKIEDKNERSLKEDNSNRNYKYIDTSEMNDCVYNSLSNTDVIDMLDELQRYFNESAESIKEFNKNANHDTGMSTADIRACELGSKLIDQIKEAFDKAWQ